MVGFDAERDPKPSITSVSSMAALTGMGRFSCAAARWRPASPPVRRAGEQGRRQGAYRHETTNLKPSSQENWHLKHCCFSLPPACFAPTAAAPVPPADLALAADEDPFQQLPERAYFTPHFLTVIERVTSLF